MSLSPASPEGSSVELKAALLEIATGPTESRASEITLADYLDIVGENPLSNLKVLYGTGHERLNPQTNRLERVGGVKFTVKDGIVYDAKKLLADVAAAVAAEKKTYQPPTTQQQ